MDKIKRCPTFFFIWEASSLKYEENVIAVSASCQLYYISKSFNIAYRKIIFTSMFHVHVFIYIGNRPMSGIKMSTVNKSL